MEIIITGASGFVGKNLSRYLKDYNYSIKALSLRNPNWKEQISSNSKAIIHLAGKAHDTSNTSSADEYFKVNKELTISLFDEFLKSDIQDFFFFSSVKAVADTVIDSLNEDAVPEPKTPYGQSKFEAETYLLNQQLPIGKRLFIIRPCMIHGPGNKGNLNLLYKVVEKGLPWPLASFDNQRSFLSVDNLSFLVKSMLENSSLPSAVYNFSDDKALSTNELIKLIALSLGIKPKLWSIPIGLIKSVVKIGDILPLPLNSERLKKLTESYVVSNNKIKNALGIEKLPLSTTEGLEKTIKSFEKNKNK